MKLLLFDIDGTLLRGGPAKTAFAEALEAVFGTAGPIDDHDFSGKTDPQIARELMTRAGKAEVVDDGLDDLWERYVAGFEARIEEDPVSVLPGVPTLVRDLATQAQAALGLVTGNIARGARLKLASAGLGEHFPIGGFGSDHEERNSLPSVALDRAEAHFGRRFRGEDVIVIGDTPRDVECGKVVGARTVAVATGHWSEVELRATGADIVFSDFSEIERVKEVLLS